MKTRKNPEDFIMIDKLNPFENPITITCESATTISFKKLKSFQGSLKKLTVKNRDKLMRSILKEGFMCPVFVWVKEGVIYLLDGHQRRLTLKYMESKGWEIPDIPIVYINAKNEKEARRKLLKITSQYGEFEKDELNDWLDDLDKEDKEDLRLVDKELKLFLSDVDKTEKINIPVVCPHCGEIID